MKNVFFRLYQQLLACLIITGIITYAGVWALNQWRLSSHAELVAKGTLSLVAEGLSRHEGEKQDQWLNAISRVIGINLIVQNIPNKSSNYFVKTSLFSTKMRIHHRIGAGNNFVNAEIREFDEDMARATALLVLNELGRHDKDNRNQAFDKLSEKFTYPIKRYSLNKLDLTPAQSRRLKRGDIFVRIDNQYQQQRFITAYAPYGQSSSALVIGPIPQFNWYPQELIWMALALLLVSISLIGLVIVKPLEKRFSSLLRAVDEIGLSAKPTQIVLPGNDSLNVLTKRINEMSKRIHQLMEHQTDLMQAVSHDLKTPIARLKFRLSLIKHAETSKERDERTEGMEKDLNELSSLVDEILILAKLEEANPEPNYTEIHLDTLLKKLIAEHQFSHQDIELELINKLEFLYADQSYMQRIVSNILTNALRYADNKILITYFSADSKNIITIEDDGAGIHPADRFKIFEAFSTTDTSRNKRLGGFGLGLAIVKNLVEAQDGKVFACSSALGGAKFTIELPEKINLYSNNRL